MTTCQRGSVLQSIRMIFGIGVVSDLTDAQLLERFASRRDESAELAFTTLVARHGPMVLWVCRRILRDPHDVEDAFQATFLVLVRKAGSIRKRASVGSWLHGVALRAAADIHSTATRRQIHERRFAEGAIRSAPDACPDDLGPPIHEEVERLPERYRAAVVLCDLEGLTHAEAARRLGWPVGTVKSRQARGRDRLRGRLLRLGLAPSVAAFGTLLADEARAAIAPALSRSTVHAALHRSMRTTSGVVAMAVLRAMAMARLKAFALPVLTLGAIAMAGVVGSLPIAGDSPSPPRAGGRSRAVIPADEPRRPDTRGVEDIAHDRRADDEDRLPGLLPGPSRDEVEALLRTIGRDPVTPELVDRATSFFRPRARQSGGFELVKRRVTDPAFVGRLDAIVKGLFGKPADSLTLIEWATFRSTGYDDAYIKKQMKETAERRAAQPLTIRGTVFDEKDGRLLPGAVVCTGEALARTDEGGRFTLSIPRPREPYVRLYFERTGYALNEVVIPLEAIPQANDRRFGLLKQELIAGCVFDHAGKPISGAELDLWVARFLVNRNGSDRLDVGRGNAMSLRARTDDLGQFVFRGVPPRGKGRRTYLHLWVRHPRFQTYKADPDRLGPGRLEDITLQAGCIVNGLVVDDKGRPVDGAWVRVHAPYKPSHEQFTYTGADGRFRFEDVSPGAWWIVVEPEQQAMVMATLTTSLARPVDLRLVASPGTYISGRVLGPDGKPSGAAAVGWLSPLGPDGVPTKKPIPDRMTRTAENGSFRLGPVPEGRYCITGLIDPPRSIGEADGESGQNDVVIRLKPEDLSGPSAR
jgi:RNA polymerase sigma factor (sigma-70 family)